ncbi:TreTu family toxin [Chryseobacterium sp. A321]
MNLAPNATFTNTSFNPSNIGLGINLDPLIQGGDNAPLMSQMAFGNSNDPNAATIGPIPDSRGKTDIQMLVSENPLVQGAALGLLTGGTGNAIRGLLTKSAAQDITTVGRWMSNAEYTTMSKTGQMIEGAGGQTFVATGGADAFTAAARGSVYAEFQVPTNSLLQGGQANWFKVIGPNAGKAMQSALQKQGGQVLPQIKNLSEIIKVK